MTLHQTARALSATAPKSWQDFLALDRASRLEMEADIRAKLNRCHALADSIDTHIVGEV